MRIILAEDDDQLRDALEMHLEDHGHSVVTVYDSAQLLRHLKIEHFDAVVTDHHMPGMSGVTVLRTMRESPVLDKIPVIVLSGRTGIEAEVLALGGIFARKEELNRSLDDALALIAA